MILIKPFVLLAIAVAAHAEAQNVPGGMGTGMRMHKRNDPSMKKRIADAVARLERRDPLLDTPLVGQGASTTGNEANGESTSSADESTTTTTTSRTLVTPPSSTSTTTPTPDPPTTTTTTTSSTPTTTSTTSSSSTTSTSSTSSSTSSGVTITAITRTAPDTYTGISFAATRSVTLSTSQNSTSDDSTNNTPDASGGPFSQNKVAVAATATVAALVALGALIFIGFWWKKKSQRGKMGEDMWDEASMKEFSHGAGAGAPVVAPPPVARHVDLGDELGGAGGAAAGGLGRSNTKVLPSQSALARSRSQHAQDVYEEEPDELLAMPPVAHYDRPRDSAYDIVPAAPPANAYASAGGQAGNAYASAGGQAGYAGAGYGYSNAAAGGGGGAYAGGGYGSVGGLAPPQRKGDHTSFGSVLGNDPFAGSGFVDASRESTYGPGQAGRGAGGAGGAGASGVHGPGNQWPQGYDPYTGYSQGSQAPYGQAGYGYAS